MDPSCSSCCGSCPSKTATWLISVKLEPQDTLLFLRNRDDNLVIDAGRHAPSPSRSHIRLVKPNKEHKDMAANLESGLAWSCTDYVKQEMEHQHSDL
ncbi:hypothetical protein D1007_61535 [Hordeum vulgare]|nr:hypothetical protein D1007_61535 [Hordeum vulgare]